jgi:hypothetical protein
MSFFRKSVPTPIIDVGDDHEHKVMTFATYLLVRSVYSSKTSKAHTRFRVITTNEGRNDSLDWLLIIHPSTMQAVLPIK